MLLSLRLWAYLVQPVVYNDDLAVGLDLAIVRVFAVGSVHGKET